MKTSQTIITILSIFIVVGCGQEDELDSYSTGVRIKKVLNEEYKTIAEYTYDRQGKLKSMWELAYFTFDNKKTELEYTYNNKNQLIECKGFLPGNPIMSSMSGAMDKEVTETFGYSTGGKLSTSTKYFDYGEFEDMNFSITTTYSYRSENNIEIKSLSSYSTNDDSYNLIVLTFDESGNISEKNSYYKEPGKEKRLFNTEKYTYDQNHNPFRSVFIPENSSVNNVTKKEIRYYESDGVSYSGSPSVYNYEYEYNRTGYPTKQTTTNPNETTEIKYFKY